jgi:hypothetical protein
MLVYTQAKALFCLGALIRGGCAQLNFMAA